MADAAQQTPPQAAIVAQAVCSAFALGWNVAEMSSLLARDEPQVAGWIALPLTGDLTADEQRDRLVRRVEVRLQVLRDALAAPASRESIQQALGPLVDQRGREELRTFHLTLSSVLMAEDSRLGKAYALGVTLWEVSVVPAGESPQPWYDRQQVGRAQHYLADLQSVLPEHAAMGVRGSLTLWQERAGDRHLSPQEAVTLVEQARVWRALLSGEKPATQDLDLDDYVYAGRRALQHGKRISGSILDSLFSSVGSAAVIVVLAVVFLVGISLPFVVGGADAQVAGVVVPVLSGGGVLGFVKKAWDSVESMWDEAKPAIMDAAVDLAVASAITQLPAADDEATPDEPTLRAHVERSVHPSGLAPRRRRGRGGRGG